MKNKENLTNPNKKLANFKCESCKTAWIKPVNYYIRRPHQAVKELVDDYEVKICSKCLKREIGKTAWYKEFINEK